MTTSGIIIHSKFIKHWLPVILVMAFIFWMSTGTFSSENTISWVDKTLRYLFHHIRYNKIVLINTIFRKTGHLVEYFVLGLLLFRGVRGDHTGTWKWRWSFYAVMIVILWAASDEYHQSFVQTRGASVADVSLDTAGGILAQFVTAYWYRIRNKYSLNLSLDQRQTGSLSSLGRTGGVKDIKVQCG